MKESRTQKKSLKLRYTIIPTPNPHPLREISAVLAKIKNRHWQGPHLQGRQPTYGPPPEQVFYDTTMKKANKLMIAKS